MAGTRRPLTVAALEDSEQFDEDQIVRWVPGHGRWEDYEVALVRGHPDLAGLVELESGRWYVGTWSHPFVEEEGLADPDADDRSFEAQAKGTAHEHRYERASRQSEEPLGWTEYVQKHVKVRLERVVAQRDQRAPTV